MDDFPPIGLLSAAILKFCCLINSIIQNAEDIYQMKALQKNCGLLLDSEIRYREIIMLTYI